MYIFIFQSVLKDKIKNALQELNDEWKFSSCQQLNEAECKDLGININCNKRKSSGKVFYIGYCPSRYNI